jgi:hypothetical protein
MPTSQPSSVSHHPRPHLGALAAVLTLLFLAGVPVTWFGGVPCFPGPWVGVSTIVAYFQTRSAEVGLCAFLHFGAAIALGIFSASMVSRLEFLGIRAAGSKIALFDGFATVFYDALECRGSVVDGASRSGPGWHPDGGSFLSGLCTRRTGLFGSRGTVDGRSLGPATVQAYDSALDSDSRPGPGRMWTIELAESRFLQSSGSHSPYTICRLPMDDRSGIRSTLIGPDASRWRPAMTTRCERDTVRLLPLVLSVPILEFLNGSILHIPPGRPGSGAGLRCQLSW